MPRVTTGRHPGQSLALYAYPVFTAGRSYASAVLGVGVSVVTRVLCDVTNPKNLPAIFLYHMKGQSF